MKCSDLLAGLIRYTQYSLVRILLGLVVLPLPAWASDKVPKTVLQAAYTYNFTQFITWPAAPDTSPFHFCVLSAKGELRELFNQINGNTVNQQVIKVVYLRGDFSLAALQSCQLVFQPEPLFTGPEHPLPRGMVWVAYNPPADDPKVSIAMYFNPTGQLRFSINQAAVAKAGVIISSQLMKLATNKQDGVSDE
jgi:hypothetical protein